MKLPNARNRNIVINELDHELLVYDLDIDKAYCLNETSAIIFNACGKRQIFEDLKHSHNFSDDLIHLALAELKANNLLEDYQSNHFAGLSRREAVKRVGLASMVALPLVAGITAPLAAQAQSAQRCPSGQILSGGNCITALCLRDQVYDTQTQSCRCINRATTNCSGTCVNTSTDESNCGVCGNVCGTGQNCMSGSCQKIAANDCSSILCLRNQICVISPTTGDPVCVPG